MSLSPPNPPVPPSREGPSDPDHFSSSFEGAIRSTFSQQTSVSHTLILQEALANLRENSSPMTSSSSRKFEVDEMFQLSRRIENESILSGNFDNAIKLLLETSPE